MRKLIWVFLGMGMLGIIAAILSVIKWGILHPDRLYLLFALSINGILIILGFFGAWVINTFDDFKGRLRNYKKDIEDKTDDIEKDMSSTQNRLLGMEGNIIDLSNKSLDKEIRREKKAKKKKHKKVKK